MTVSAWTSSLAFRAVLDHRARILDRKGAIAPTLAAFFGSHALHCAIVETVTP